MKISDFFTRKKLLLLCIVIIVSGLTCTYIDHSSIYSMFASSQETWWGDGAFSFFVTPLIVIMLSGLTTALVIAIVSYLISKKHASFMWVGTLLVALVTGLTIWGENYKNDSLWRKALDKTKYRYSKENLLNSLGGSIWRDEDKKIEIRFSSDGKTAKTIINNNETDFEKYEIKQEEVIDKYGNRALYELINFKNGILALPEIILYHTGFPHVARFIPIIRKPKITNLANPYASLRSITHGVQDGAYSAAQESLNYKIEYEDDYGIGIDMQEYRRDMWGNECEIDNLGILIK